MHPTKLEGVVDAVGSIRYDRLHTDFLRILRTDIPNIRLNKLHTEIQQRFDIQGSLVPDPDRTKDIIGV